MAIRAGTALPRSSRPFRALGVRRQRCPSPRGHQPAHREPPPSLRGVLVLDTNGARDGQSPSFRRRASPDAQSVGPAPSRRLWKRRSLHHLSLVQRTSAPADGQRAPLHSGSPSPQQHRRAEYEHRPRIEPFLVAGHPHEDHARIYDPGRNQPGCPGLPPFELPTIGSARRSHHYQLQQLAAQRSTDIWKWTKKRSG